MLRYVLNTFGTITGCDNQHSLAKGPHRLMAVIHRSLLWAAGITVITFVHGVYIESIPSPMPQA